MDSLPVGFDEVVEDQLDPLDIVDPDAQAAIEQLARIGYLTDEFDYCGVHFAIRTIYPIEELAAAAAIKEFTDTLKAPEAWGNAQIALALEAIDYDDKFCERTGNMRPEQFARARFNYITSKFHQPVLDHLYSKYLVLIEKRDYAFKEAQNLSLGSPLSFLIGAGSSNEPGISLDQTSSEFQPSTSFTPSSLSS